MKIHSNQQQAQPPSLCSFTTSWKQILPRYIPLLIKKIIWTNMSIRHIRCIQNFKVHYAQDKIMCIIFFLKPRSLIVAFIKHDGQFVRRKAPKPIKKVHCQNLLINRAVNSRLYAYGGFSSTIDNYLFNKDHMNVAYWKMQVLCFLIAKDNA